MHLSPVAVHSIVLWFLENVSTHRYRMNYVHIICGPNKMNLEKCRNMGTIANDILIARSGC